MGDWSFLRPQALALTAPRRAVPLLRVSRHGRYTDFVEACYAPIEREDAWIQNLAAASQKALDAVWAQAVSFRITGSSVELGEASDGEFASAWGPERRLPSTFLPGFVEFDVAGVREVMTPAQFDASLEHRTPPAAMVDASDRIFAIQGRATTHDGVMAFWAARRPLTTAERARLRKLAAHLRAAARVRLHRPVIEAVLDHAGRVHHAETLARNDRALQTLSRGARAIESARTARTTETLETWHALWDGRWTLVDSFDRDGKRWLVARANNSSTPLDSALQPRERDVALGAVAGRSLKLMAYELGLPMGTVASTLSRVMRKLRVRSRAQLATLLAPITPDAP